jgi:hypothetical protein
MQIALRLLVASFVLFAAAPSFGQERKIAKFQWNVGAVGNNWELNGFDWTDGFNEQDSLVRISCKRGGKFEIGLGAAVEIGKGRGEAVAMTANSGMATVRIDGVSKKSANFEMTSGVELVKSSDANDLLIELLKMEGPVTFRTQPGAKSYTFPAKGFGAAFAKLKARCT